MVPINDVPHAAERDEWGQHSWGHCKWHVFDGICWYSRQPTLIFPKVPGRTFFTTVKNHYLRSGPICVDPIRPEPRSPHGRQALLQGPKPLPRPQPRLPTSAAAGVGNSEIPLLGRAGFARGLEAEFYQFEARLPPSLVRAPPFAKRGRNESPTEPGHLRRGG